MEQRVRFRLMHSGDMDTIYQIYSDKEAMKFRGSDPIERVADAEKFILAQNRIENGIHTVRKGVELIASLKLIGSVMFRYDEKNKEVCEIGYSIGKQFWNCGYGKEIVRLQIAELKAEGKVKSIIAQTNKQNKASIRILEHTGFERMERNPNSSYFTYKKLI